MVAIITIYRLTRKFPNAVSIVVVPSIKLYKDWQDHIENFKLQNVQVYVVNSYVQNYITRKVNNPNQDVRWNCDLLIADEVHNYLSEDAMIFNQTINCTNYRMFLVFQLL